MRVVLGAGGDAPIELRFFAAQLELAGSARRERSVSTHASSGAERSHPSSTPGISASSSAGRVRSTTWRGWQALERIAVHSDDLAGRVHRSESAANSSKRTGRRASGQGRVVPCRSLPGEPRFTTHPARSCRGASTRGSSRAPIRPNVGRPWPHGQAYQAPPTRDRDEVIEYRERGPAPLAISPWTRVRSLRRNTPPLSSSARAFRLRACREKTWRGSVIAGSCSSVCRTRRAGRRRSGAALRSVGGKKPSSTSADFARGHRVVSVRPTRHRAAREPMNRNVSGRSGASSCAPWRFDRRAQLREAVASSRSGGGTQARFAGVRHRKPCCRLRAQMGPPARVHGRSPLGERVQADQRQVRGTAPVANQHQRLGSARDLREASLPARCM